MHDVEVGLSLIYLNFLCQNSICALPFGLSPKHCWHSTNYDLLYHGEHHMALQGCWEIKHKLLILKIYFSTICIWKELPKCLIIKVLNKHTKNIQCAWQNNGDIANYVCLPGRGLQFILSHFKRMVSVLNNILLKEEQTDKQKVRKWRKNSE